MAPAKKLLDVFPERSVQMPGDKGQQKKKQQHSDTDPDADVLCGLTHPLQIPDEIAYGLVVLQGRHGAGRDLLPALEDRDL